MTLRDAIIHAREKAKECSGTECGDQHLQLALWLEELMKYREEHAKTISSAKEDLDLPEAAPIQMVTETFGGLKVKYEND